MVADSCRILLTSNNEVAACVYNKRVEFPEGSPLRNIVSVDIPDFRESEFRGRRIIPHGDPQFPEAFTYEVERRLKQQGYHWQE